MIHIQRHGNKRQKRNKQKIIVLGYISLIIFCTLTSCSFIKYSDYAKYNKIDRWMYNTYQNDSLSISIDFYGSHNIIVEKKWRKRWKKFKAYIKQYALSDRKMLFVSRSRNNYFGYTILGMTADEEAHKKFGTKLIAGTTNLKDTFFHSPCVDSYKNFIAKVYAKNIQRDMSFWMFAFKEKVNDIDTSLFAFNVDSQFQTIVSGGSYKFYNDKRRVYDAVLDSVFYLKDYICSIDILRSSLFDMDYVANKPIETGYIQALATRYGMIDDIKNVKKTLYMFGNDTTDEGDLKNIVQPSQTDAMHQIISAAKTSNFVFINESHYDWRHRFFVTLMLDSLYKIGYRKLAVEALSPYRSIDVDTFVNKRWGIYILEPFFGNLLREARRIGFELIAYEDTSGVDENYPIQKRERLQAFNLFNKLKCITPDTKCIVYAGYAHINKNGFDSENESMYQEFLKLFKTPPKAISVNQTLYSDLFSKKRLPDTLQCGYYLIKPGRRDSLKSDFFVINNIKEIPYTTTNFFPYTNYETYIIPFVSNTLLNEEKYIYIYVKKEFEALGELAVPIFIGKFTDVNGKKIFLQKDEYVGRIQNSEPFKLLMATNGICCDKK